MKTPLFWKTWQLSNLVYETLLRYNLPVKMLPSQGKFVLLKYFKKIHLIRLILLHAFILYINLVIQAVILRSIELKTYVVLINTAMAGTVALCLVLSGLILPCAHTLFVQFFNTQIQYNNFLLQLSGHPVPMYNTNDSTINLLRKGNSKPKEPFI